MSGWTNDELREIGAADEVELTTLRSDGTPRKPVTIWVVRSGDDLFTRKAGLREVGVDVFPNRGQELPEAEQVRVLGGIAYVAPARVVHVLLASPGVATGREDVAVGARTDPDVGPGRRVRD